MGNACSVSKKNTKINPQTVPIPVVVSSDSMNRRDSHIVNLHPVNPEIKIHSTISADFDFDHTTAMTIPLGEVNDEQLLAEVARRKLDLHDKITDSLVRESYVVKDAIASGSSGDVYLVTSKATLQKFACKVVRKNTSINDAQSMSTELEIMKRIRHRNVVSVHELYETPNSLWIILELVDGGDLSNFLATCPNYNEVVAARFLKQALNGVHYLHALGVVHRDLKLDNILLSGSGAFSDVKIADFGLSALVRLDEQGYDAEESGKRKRYDALRDMWGTKEYFAPELIKQAYGPQADVWALGCVFYEMLCGEQAFPVRERDDDKSFYGRICKGQYDTSGACWKKISPEAKDLLSKMLCVDPVERFSASECLLHPWVTGRAHTEMHNQPLTDCQTSMVKRQERKNKKAVKEKKRKSLSFMVPDSMDKH